MRDNELFVCRGCSKWIETHLQGKQAQPGILGEDLPKELAARLVHVFSNTHLQSILFLRHGNTNKAADDSEGADLARVLSDTGAEQCAKARDGWFGDIRVGAEPVCIVSVAQRTTQTINAMLGDDARQAVIKQAGAIYFEPRSAQEKVFWSKHAYSPLQAYWEDSDEAKAIWGAKAQAIVEDVVHAIEDIYLSAVECPETVVVVGHAIYQNAAAVLVANALGQPFAGLLEADLGEAEGLLVGRDAPPQHLRC